MRRIIILLIGLLCFTGCGSKGLLNGNKTYDIGTEIFFNPEENSICLEDEVDENVLGRKGCMRWYVISDDGDSVNLILEHNTTDYVAAGRKDELMSDGITPLLEALSKDTATWDESLDARIPSAEDIAKAIGTTFVNGMDAVYLNSGTDKCAPIINGVSDFDWLYNNISSCENYYCGKSIPSGITGGYWLSTSNIKDGEYTGHQWEVDFTGQLTKFGKENNYTKGIRPIITAEKSILK